jgi:hypothetical protein
MSLSVPEIIEEAFVLELPDLIALGKAIADLIAKRGDGSEIDAANAAANLGADAIEDTRFPPAPSPIISSLPKVG